MRDLIASMEKFDAWLDQIHDREGRFDYRAIYSAYLDAAGGHESKGGESSARRLDDGGFEIRVGRETIVLADDAEREALAAHMVRRYCGDRYPDMRAWEDQRHSWYVEDLHDWSNDIG
ncbi:hypothetical protein GPX89_08785 [Nocardia sp. ET3-3]|uniref:Uncharacterized protein n=1 Tax=Nocardia terrae TaxID=2675851 RepID=A0A7K1UST9_9NOCA|nr:hypothetical protein [Nocardia terrae]MVU77341.1 hypothetical protein [Nocardia terrae]